MDFNIYMSSSNSAAFAEVPVYHDEETGLERPVDWKGSGLLLAGCKCRERKTPCSALDACECTSNQLPGPNQQCASSECPVCIKHPARCKVFPLCECRKNVIDHVDDDDVFVCNDLCHGRKGSGCDFKYKLSPRENAVKIEPQEGMGLGLRATKPIGVGTSMGTYSGVLRSALELYEIAQGVEIGRTRSLGISAYINRALKDGTSTTAVPSPEGEYPVNDVLAAHVVNGRRHILVDWEGHKAPTWQLDEGNVAHSYTCEHLREYDDEDPECQRDIGPEAYTLYAGTLRPFDCCADCRDPTKHKDGWDRRVYVDASRKGNCNRHINHSCDANCRVLPARLGSHPHALVVPLILADRDIPKGAFLSFAYWHLENLTNDQRRKLREQSSHRPDACRCGSKHCTGWYRLPPRAALLNAGVSPEEVADLWLDDEYTKPDCLPAQPS